jgi:hypothetical protein
MAMFMSSSTRDCSLGQVPSESDACEPNLDCKQSHTSEEVSLEWNARTVRTGEESKLGQLEPQRCSQNLHREMLEYIH